MEEEEANLMEEEEEYKYVTMEEIYVKMMTRRLPPGEDRISKLPDSLVSQILSYLPTKDIVSTSVLSKRWKNVWLLIPELVLDASVFPNHNDFRSFTDRFVDFARLDKSCLHKLKLSVPKDVNQPPCVTRWVDSVATPKLQQLDVECLSVNRKSLEMIPLSLYVCDTLVYLRLHRVQFGEFDSVSLPCLKTMRLEENVYANDAALESFISSCLALEDLIIVRMIPDNVKVLRVHSQTLTCLQVELMFGEGDDFDDDDFEREVTGVLIDAPRLKYLKFRDDLSYYKIITNPGALAEINLDFIFQEFDIADVVDLPKRNMVRNFFTSISGVPEMTISTRTVEFLYYNMDFDPLPQFCNLSRLKVKISYLPYVKCLPKLLESCPNLKSLVVVLKFNPSEDKGDVKLSSVPQCLLSSLEVVELKYFNGGPAKMEVARYFLENSVVLKKLVPELRGSWVGDGFNLLKDLTALTRLSSKCQIIL